MWIQTTKCNNTASFMIWRNNLLHSRLRDFQNVIVYFLSTEFLFFFDMIATVEVNQPGQCQPARG